MQIITRATATSALFFQVSRLQHPELECGLVIAALLGTTPIQNSGVSNSNTTPPCTRLASTAKSNAGPFLETTGRMIVLQN
jgi:hypothetical protein